MKKILSLLLMAVFTIQASAYDFSVVTEGQFPMRLYYAINPDGKTATVVEGPGTYAGTEVIIPSTVTNEGKTYTVTTIGASAFVNADITTVIMPNTITDIQNNAFSGSDVAQVTFSKGLKRIGDYAFYFAKNLVSAELYEGIESIGEFAFHPGQYGGAGIWEVSLPSTLTYIGNSAFLGTRLTSVKWPTSLTTIPERTFHYCTYLSEIELPETVSSIGKESFTATALDTIIFPSALIEIGDEAYSNTRVQYLKIPAHIKKIGEDVFLSCTLLKSVTFLNGCTEVGEDMFSGCTQLMEVKLPTSLRKIRNGAFANCTHLSNIVLPEGLTEVEGYVFGNSGIMNVSIPSTLTALGNSMFSSCEKLTEIKIPFTIKILGNSIFDYCSNLMKVSLPSGLTKIPEAAFRGCSALENITIPETVDSIEGSAFNECKKLKDMELPKRLKYLGGYAFEGCESLSSLSLPYTIENMGARVFPSTTPFEAHVARSIPPTIHYSGWFLIPVIEEHNNATLYVPRGCKEAYEGDDHWNKFKSIVEEDVEGLATYQVAVNMTDGYGEIYVNGVNGETAYEVEANKDVILTFKPYSDYLFKQLIINGEDVTEKVVNNEYTIPAINANQRVEVAFKQTPVILSIKSGNGGRVDVSVEKGNPFTFNVVAEEGWTINCVTFNGMDVTSDLTDGAYTTPALYDNATLNVSFENPSDGVKDYIYSQAKVYGYDGRIIVSGASAGETIQIYSEAGVCVANAIASESEWSASVEQGHVYIVKLPTKIVKVAL